MRPIGEARVGQRALTASPRLMLLNMFPFSVLPHACGAIEFLNVGLLSLFHVLPRCVRIPAINGSSHDVPNRTYLFSPDEHVSHMEILLRCWRGRDGGEGRAFRAHLASPPGPDPSASTRCGLHGLRVLCHACCLLPTVQSSVCLTEARRDNKKCFAGTRMAARWHSGHEVEPRGARERTRPKECRAE